MKNLQQKLDQLKWLKSVGIEYYCSEEKDSKISLINELAKITKESKAKEVVVRQKPKVKIPAIKNDLIPTSKSNQNTFVSLNAAIDIDPSSRALADKAKTIVDLRRIVENFNGCDLKNFATNTVFSDGIKGAKILLIGEAPGATEDKEGIPFCGESGRLLDAMLATIGIDRKKNAYITNTIFWRPPANRRPTRQEIEICKPFVEKHIALAKPKLIILVGGTAVTSLLGEKESISQIRQNNYSYTNKYLSEPIHATSIFHPAYLLRQPTKKKIAWYDLLKIQEFIKANIIT